MNREQSRTAGTLGEIIRAMMERNLLYKYTKLNEVFFQNRNVRFTQPINFNDPFEGQVNNKDLLMGFKCSNRDFDLSFMDNAILEDGLFQTITRCYNFSLSGHKVKYHT